uniref:CSON009903 protein n=1 Tax=Culicoides sonorensis TaxID=179676 RepID=A0A336M177_CULSO
MAFNNDELVPPPWMTENFFAIALGKFEHDPKLKINSIEIKPATLVGDHFASIMFRVTAEYDIPKYKKFNEKRVMIVKTVPFGDGNKAEMLKNSPIFKTESKMYAQVLPEMERLLHAAGDNIKLCPKLIYQSYEPAPIIILEDISVDGYEMSGKPVDYETGLKIASTLAKFHATSMYINEKDMDLSNIFNESFVIANIPNTNLTFMDVGVMPNMELLLDELKSWPDNDLVVDKFIKMKGKLVKAMKDVYGRKNQSIYSVLNHSDFHFKNIMFRYEKERVESLQLLDFQCCLWATPAIDVNYLLYMMLNTEARERRQDVLLHYYNEFSSTLKKIGYLGRIPTLLDLNMELLINGAHENLMVFCMILFQFMDFSDVTDTDELFDLNKDKTDQAAKSRALFKHPRYQEILKRELPRLIGLGILG